MRYLFIRIPRTASTSICKALNNYPDHTTASKLKEITPDWNDLFKFSIVRNPYDRFLSMYKYFYPEVNFDKFMQEKQYEGDLRFIPQTCYVYSQNKLMVDYLGRYEDLENSWKYIANKLKVNPILEHLKPTTSKPILSEKHRNDIYLFYHKDFQLLNYE